jgi:hypothetical protein
MAGRARNAWSPAYTALVNGLEPEVVLSAGQPIKITRLEPVGHEGNAETLKN